jgi:hypothetical protein
MAIATIKQDDTARYVEDTLEFNDAAINLTGATVVFVLRRIKDENGNVVNEDAVRRDAVVVSAVAGTVRYQLVAADTEDAGLYRCEWEVTLADLTILTVPDDGYNFLKILPDVG